MKHKHHIIPKHMGGGDENENLIELTIEEHAEEHRKLYEKYGKQEDLLAWKGLSKQIGMEDIQLMRSSIGGIKGNLGVKKSENHKKKISQIRKTQKWNSKTKDKISKSMNNNTNSKNHNSDSYREKQSQVMKEAWKRRKNKTMGL